MEIGTIIGFGIIAFILWAVADNFIGEESDNKKANFKVWLLAGAIGIGVVLLATVSDVIFPQ